MRRYAGCVMLFALLAGPATAATDCSRPNKSSIDMMLCSNDKLALADNIMARAFRDAFNRTERREALIEDQERWRKTVRDACKDVPCLMRAYQDRTSELDTW
ncbi:MAG TPA: lysozyme inhibitor LprI family protein [Burkholderiales bacterium]|nr:lysozyme inhibitor LprI family protein [Burkholderiales bacterium]